MTAAVLRTRWPRLGGRTSNPDLIGARKAAADTQYHYTFDDNVWPGVAPSDFVLYTDNGTEIEGEAADVDGREVHVTFPREIEDYDSGDIVLAAVNPQADTPERDRRRRQRRADHRRRQGDRLADHPSGPHHRPRPHRRRDRCRRPAHDADVRRARRRRGSVDASRIYIATGDDELVQVERIAEIEGEKVYVKANENDLESLVGVTLEPDAIEDPEGNGNPLGTVADGNAHELGTTGAL